MSAKSETLKAIIDSAAKSGIKAYHGSPHDMPRAQRYINKQTGKSYVVELDNPVQMRIVSDTSLYEPVGEPSDLGMFDISKMGTGEGAQAYGRGLYFAESEKVANEYRDQLTPRDLDYEDWLMGKYKDAESNQDYARMEMYEKAMMHDKPQDFKDLAADTDYDEDYRGLAAEVGEEIEEYGPNLGSMYEVNIDVEPDELLDWYKPLDEQSDKVSKVLSDAFRSTVKDPDGVAVMGFDGEIVDRASNYSPEEWKLAEKTYRKLGNKISTNLDLEMKKIGSGMGMHEALQQRLGGADKVAEYLQSKGVKGVKYADAFTRHKSPDKQSMNYVIFDDRLIEISKKYGISIPAAYMMLKTEESEAGMRDPTLKALREGMDIAEKAPAQFNRGTRNMAKRASLSPQEKAAIEESLSGQDSALAMNVARDWKKRHPRKDWAQPAVTGASLNKDGKLELKFKAMPYAYNIDPKTGKQVEAGSAQFKKISDGVADEVIDYFKRAENPDDLAARNVINNAGWYKNVERRLRNEYGSFSEMTGDLLGATSPNTPVATNFRFTKDILDGFARGEFDELMEGFADSIDTRYALEDQAAAFLKAERAAGRKVKDIEADPTYTSLIDESKKIGQELRDQRNIIRQRNGKQFGINSYNAMIALADKFRIRRAGSAPKAKNFAGNLVGDSQEATIDVWSARNLRKHSGRKPIPSSAEQGVTGKVVDPDNFVSNLEFGFGQDVIRDATDKINQFIGPDNPLYPLDPRDVQALQWFAEKDLWTKKGWTSKTGEGGSFEQMLDADPVESMFLGLSREQTMDTQGKDFVPTSGQMLESMSNILKPANTDPDVVTYKGLPTSGAYLGSPETALDIEIVSKQDFIPVETLDLAAIQAAEDAQDSWFVARRIKDDLGASRPEMFTVGSEIFFDGPKLADSDLIQDISDYLVKNNIPAYTMIVDPRDANSVIGLRVLDIPQFSGDSKNYAIMSTDEYRDTVGKKYGQFETLGRNLEEEFGQVKAATAAYFDVNVKSLADTKDYLGQYGTAARDPDALRQEFYGFKPAQERFRQWEGQSLPYYRKYKAPDSERGKKSEGIDGLGFNDKSPKAVGAGITGLGAAAMLSSEEAEAGGMGVKSRKAPKETVFRSAKQKDEVGLPSLVGQLGLGAMSEIGGAILGGAAGVDEYLGGLGRPGGTAEEIRAVREDTARRIGGLYDAGPEAQALGQDMMRSVGETVAPVAEYAMKGPIMDERGLNMVPLIAQKLGIPVYQALALMFGQLPERDQEGLISASDALL